MELTCPQPPCPNPRRPNKQRPSYVLSVQLLQCYKTINEKYYNNKKTEEKLKQAKKEQRRIDDEQGNYIIQEGDEIAGKYVVKSELGKGSFGVVVKAIDKVTREELAVKVIKNKPQFFQQAKVEIDILKNLNSKAQEHHNIVKLKDYFTWKDHICIAFELLSFNLYDLLKHTKYQGVPLSLVRKFSVQILRTLKFLSTCNRSVIHCDLKPENILLRSSKRSAIKVIDFGSSCYTNNQMFTYIQSRFYRAPEVILGLGYDTPIDMWSLGCILVEMHTGRPLFDGHDEGEQLLKFQSIMGPIPNEMIEASPKRSKFFQWDSTRQRWVLAPPNKDASAYPRQRLEDILKSCRNGKERKDHQQSDEDYRIFLNCLQDMLRYNPKDRIRPVEAMKDEFVLPVLHHNLPTASESSEKEKPSVISHTSTTTPAAPISSPIRSRGVSASGRTPSKRSNSASVSKPRLRSQSRESTSVRKYESVVKSPLSSPIRSPREVVNAGAEPRRVAW